jgi:hypothetical protein
MNTRYAQGGADSAFKNERGLDASQPYSRALEGGANGHRWKSLWRQALPDTAVPVKVLTPRRS